MKKTNLKEAHPPKDLVAITGKKKALLIGINYTGTKNELRGCINDVKNLREFLLTRGFHDTSDAMKILTDDQTAAEGRPTKQNIMGGIDWLVKGAQPGDHLFFHYSGHGSQVKDTSGDEDDGFDETIVPLDFGKAGQIVDDELHDKMVKPLLKGVRLTAIFDCCHSGTALDLPFIYKTSGLYTEKPGEVDKGEVVAKRELTTGDAAEVTDRGLFSDIKNYLFGGGSSSSAPTSSHHAPEDYVPEFDEMKTKGACQADIISISGCRDDQTSADVKTAGSATGAMSLALLTVLKQFPNPTLIELLNRMRDALRERKFTQVPQMSTGHHMNPNCHFSF
jgi:hypothetical protein